MSYGYKFNKNKVLKSAKRRSRKALEFIARDLQQQMRRKLKVQTKKQPHGRPGEPPRIDTPQSPLKKLINYAITDRKVYVGPMIFRAAKGRQPRPVPSILEEGGRAIAHRTENLNAVSRRFDYHAYLRRIGRESWFKTDAARRRAVQSSGFKMWYRRNTAEINVPVDVKARPFVRVTFDEYLRKNGVNKAIQRAKEYCDKRKI